MTKYSFLNELDQLLSGLAEDERREILEDYEEHFAFAKRAEKSDAEIIALVGTPADIAAEILGHPEQKNATNEKKEREEQEKELEKQAKALEEQAAILEAKLAAQAKALEEQAEALAQQSEKQQENSFGTQVGSLVDTLTATVGSVVGSVSDVITESFEIDSEGLPEHAVQSESLIEEIVDMGVVKNVIIEARNQKVSIEKTTYPTARIRLSRGMLAVKVEGDTLYIESRALKRKLSFGSFVTIEQSGSSLEVELPEIVYNLIQAKTINAKIEIEAFKVDELNLETNNGKLEVSSVIGDKLKLKTGNGRIEVEEVKGSLTAKTSNGKISLADVDGNVDVKTNNGKIELDGITGDIIAKTSNGRIEFENDTIKQNVRLSTSNSGIAVGLKQKPEHATFELSTSNAKTKLFDTERNYDVFGDGTYKVKLTTSNGRIEVE